MMQRSAACLRRATTRRFASSYIHARRVLLRRKKSEQLAVFLADGMDVFSRALETDVHVQSFYPALRNVAHPRVRHRVGEHQHRALRDAHALAHLRHVIRSTIADGEVARIVQTHDDAEPL